MGQPIVVAEQASRSHPGIVRFETNRALTGMGHERYPSREAATGVRPPDELARRLFDHGGVAAVHINGNIITICGRGINPNGDTEAWIARFQLGAVARAISRKGCDLLVVNAVGENRAFEVDNNDGWVLAADGNEFALEHGSKSL